MGSRITKVTKRDGNIVDFDRAKIERVINFSIMDTEKHSFNIGTYKEIALVRAKKVTDAVIENLVKYYVKDFSKPLNIETIQDCVEQTLISHWMIEHGESYMLYREGKAKVRNGEILKEQFSGHGVNLDKFKEIYLWNIAHECDTIPKLNDWARERNGKKFVDLINM